MSGGIIATIVLILGIISLISILPFIFSSLSTISNPTTENTQKLIDKGTETIVDVATPWWLPLITILGPIGAIIIALIAIFAPKLLNA